MLSLWRNKLSIELQDGQLLVRPSKHPHRVHGAICEGLLRLKLYRPQTLSDLSISITAKANIMTETGAHRSSVRPQLTSHRHQSRHLTLSQGLYRAR